MNKKANKTYFADKKITVLGLGLLGGLLNDIRFLAEHGADLLVTDLKSSTALRLSLEKLRKYKNIKYILGGHRLKDFKNTDMILQPGNVPMDSPYLVEAKKNNIPIFVSESLFAKHAPDITMVGITGTRGKSTTAQLIYEIIKEALRLRSGQKHPRVFLAGNVKNVSTLALLDQVKPGDIVVMELDSWALHGMGDIKQSPHIAVFTNFMTDHQNYYGSTALTTGGSTRLTTGKSAMDLYFADKANIFLNQKAGDYLVAGQEVLKKVKSEKLKVKSQIISPDIGVIPSNWKIKLLGEHNRQNVAYAVTVTRILDVPEATIKRAVEAYKGVPGRLEFISEVKGVKYYNDTTATTPEACLAALKALKTGLKGEAGIILISGGTDKMLDYGEYAKEVPKKVKALVLFKGSATDKIVQQLQMSNVNCQIEYKYKKLPVVVVDNMKDAVKWAKKYAVKDDIVLLSPGAASFGLFKNEFDRGEQFNKIIKFIN